MFFSVTHSWEEHGTIARNAWASATVQLGGEWSTYYKNLSEDDVRGALDLEKVFKEYQLGVKNRDLQFWGIKSNAAKQ